MTAQQPGACFTASFDRAVASVHAVLPSHQIQNSDTFWRNFFPFPKIRYMTEVMSIVRTQPGDNSSGFTLIYNADQSYMEDEHCKCAVVIVATGR